MGHPLDSLPRPDSLDARRLGVDVHKHLRRLIIDNVIPSGTILKQAELARNFGISRTPMREAFRQLQEEGLIEAETNQRARVRELDPDELDQLYGVRIALESLGARITAGTLTDLEIQTAHGALKEMERTRLGEDTEAWMVAHRIFHLVCVCRAGEPLKKVIESYSERSERYLRAHQLGHPLAFEAADREHVGILGAIVAGDARMAGGRMAEHLSHTSLTVLRDLDPRATAPVTHAALSMAKGGMEHDGSIPRVSP